MLDTPSENLRHHSAAPTQTSATKPAALRAHTRANVSFENPNQIMNATFSLDRWHCQKDFCDFKKSQWVWTRKLPFFFFFLSRAFIAFVVFSFLDFSTPAYFCTPARSSRKFLCQQSDWLGGVTLETRTELLCRFLWAYIYGQKIVHFCLETPPHTSAPHKQFDWLIRVAFEGLSSTGSICVFSFVQRCNEFLWTSSPLVSL